jgi:hypothetical protein
MVPQLQAGPEVGRDLQMHILAPRGCHKGADRKNYLLKHEKPLPHTDLASGTCAPGRQRSPATHHAAPSTIRGALSPFVSRVP